jgi:hypothetical protein
MVSGKCDTICLSTSTDNTTTAIAFKNNFSVPRRKLKEHNLVYVTRVVLVNALPDFD